MLANRGFTSALVVGGLISIGACADREPREPAGEERRAALTSGAFFERAKLLPSGGATNSELSQIAISGDTIVVGGPGTNFGPTAPVGAAYVFVRPPGGWSGSLTEQAKLVPSDGLPGDLNRDGTVDAADYVVWRDAFEQSGNLAADANEGISAFLEKRTPCWTGQ